MVTLFVKVAGKHMIFDAQVTFYNLAHNLQYFMASFFNQGVFS